MDDAKALAVLYKSQGRLTEAEPLYRRALSIFKGTFAAMHPHARSCEANYERLVAAMGSSRAEIESICFLGGGRAGCMIPQAHPNI
jgi:hypothetical protein